jgi:hypothetical protein
VYEKIVQLKLESKDGKRYATDCLDTQNLLRLIQSILPPKAEPLKMWLAKVGYERIEETEDPETGIDRLMELIFLSNEEYLNFFFTTNRIQFLCLRTN